MKVDKNIEIFSSDLVDKGMEVLCALFFRDNENIVQMRISLNEISIRFFDQICQRGLRTILLKDRNSRGGHNDVAYAAQADEKDLFYGGEINLWSVSLVQWLPRL